MSIKVRRREFIAAGAVALGGALLNSRIAFAAARSAGAKRFVFILLRGALDGLGAVPPYGDPAYARQRGELAVGPGEVLKLDAVFGLNPSLRFLHESFAARELLVFHALAGPYRERSHFDGQDMLESGFGRPHAIQTGWLNRALSALPTERGVQRREEGVALGQNVPLVMRGPAPVVAWSPARLAALDDDILGRIGELYSSDPLLSTRLADALAADAAAAGNPEAADMLATRERGEVRRNVRYVETVRSAAGFLRREDGPRVAVFDTIGWDTHANEGAARGQLASRLGALDDGLRELKQQLGPVWSDTAVLLATEFGRTVAINGTRGTDHGTGAAAFLLGGAVDGGRVIADWPGISMRALYQQRDLRPTRDLRSVMKGVLSDHLRIANGELERSVFPDSSAARALAGLIRA